MQTPILPGARVRRVPVAARRKDAAENREALLFAAESVLADEPLASLDTIAQTAGLSRRALYGHFPDRDALVREVISVAATQFAAIAHESESGGGAPALRGSGGTGDPRLALARLAAGLWRDASAVRASANIAANSAYVSAVAQALAPIRERLAELTRAGMRDGVFRADMSPELLALLVEETASATLREPRIASGDASAVVRVALSIVGLSWETQRELLEAHPELLS